MKPRDLVSCVLVLGIALLACKSGGEVKANVDCKGTSETIDCDVTHVSGSTGANVCWSLKFTCQNGTIATADNVCQPVQPGATAQKRIPITELKNFDQCDKATSTEVIGLTLTAL